MAVLFRTDGEEDMQAQTALVQTQPDKASV